MAITDEGSTVRRVTRLDKAYDSLHALFGRAVVVAHLMEDLITSPRAAGVEAAADVMNTHRIDVVGAIDADDARTVVGYFSRAGFASFDDVEVIAASASLKDALAMLRERPRLFVRDEGGVVVGIVTRADLQKPPFRLYCFGLITLLEMHLLQVIRAHYVDDTAALAALNKPRAAKVIEMFERRSKRGLDIGLSDCLEFADKRDIVACTPVLREQLGFKSKTALEKQFDAWQEIRDDLAHGQLLDGGRDWTDVIARMLEVESLLLSATR